MDNVTHTLVGAVLAETGLKRLTPLATTTLLISANFPDIDVVVGLLDSLVYLEHHRGITHAIAAIPLLSILLAGMVTISSRWWRRRHPHQPRARFWSLALVSFIGMSTHPLLDFTNSYGWRPFLPWNQSWYYGDIAFVVDPWIWAVLGGSLVLATGTSRQRLLNWGILFAILALPVFLYGGASFTIKLIWSFIVVTFFALRAIVDPKLKHTQIIMRTVIFSLLVYLGALSWLHKAVLAQTQNAAVSLIPTNEQITKIDALPLPANPFLWRTVISTNKAFYFSDRTLLDASASEAQRFDRESGEAQAIAAALREPELQTFLRFARFPTLTAYRKPDQTTDVEIRDIRFFDSNNRRNSSFRFAIHLDAQLRRIVD